MGKGAAFEDGGSWPCRTCSLLFEMLRDDGEGSRTKKHNRAPSERLRACLTCYAMLDSEETGVMWGSGARVSTQRSLANITTLESPAQCSNTERGR